MCVPPVPMKPTSKNKCLTNLSFFLLYLLSDLGCQNDDGGGAYIRCLLVTFPSLFHTHVILPENH